MEDSGIDTNDNETARCKLKASKTAAAASSDAVPNGFTISDSESENESLEEWNPRSNQNNAAKPSLAQNKESQSQESPKHSLLSENCDEQSELRNHSQTINFEPASITTTSIKPSGMAYDVRHKQTDVKPGLHGARESASLLVDVPFNDDHSDSEEDIPLSWQRSSRSMREQLLRDGYNLDLESDNEDLDLIPPKPQNFGVGGLCSCSSEGCTIS